MAGRRARLNNCWSIVSNSHPSEATISTNQCRRSSSLYQAIFVAEVRGVANFSLPPGLVRPGAQRLVFSPLQSTPRVSIIVNVGTPWRGHIAEEKDTLTKQILTVAI